MDQAAGGHVVCFVIHNFPELFEKQHVCANGVQSRAFRSGSYDVATGPLVIGETVDDATQSFPFILVFNPRRNPYARSVGQINEIPRRDRDAGCQTRALAAKRVFQNLHQDVTAFTHEIANTDIVVTLDSVFFDRRARDVGFVEKSGTVQTDVDKSSLHTRQNPGHLAAVYVTDQPTPAGALDKHFLDSSVRDQRCAGLARRFVDKNFLFHLSLPSCPATSIPRSRNSSAVSNSGKPTTPE